MSNPPRLRPAADRQLPLLERLGKRLCRRFILSILLCCISSSICSCRRSRIGPLRVPPPPSFFNTAPIRVDGFAEDAVLRRRIVAMPFGEAAARLGSLHFESRTHFAFSQPGGRSYEQSDRASVHYDSQNNLHVLSASPAAQLELLTAGDKVFVRYDTGQLRQKTRRDVDVDELPEKAFAGLSQVLDLIDGVVYADARQDTLGGRQVTRFRLKLGPSPVPEAQAVVPTSGARLPAAPPGRWRQQAQVLNVAGTLAVDNDTAVLLEAEIDARLEIRDAQIRPTTLVVHHSHAVSEAGQAGNVRAPSRSIAEFRRPIRPRDPLAFFRGSLGSTAQTAPAENPAEPDDEAAAAQRPGAPPPAPQD